MEYYIIENKIIGFDAELDEQLYSYTKLDQEQKAFYETNRCSVYEVLEMKLNTVYVPTLEELKPSKINYFSDVAFQQRSDIIPDYKLINAGLGIYDEVETASIAETVRKYRAEYYRCKALVETAQTIEELNNIEFNVESV